VASDASLAALRCRPPQVLAVAAHAFLKPILAAAGAHRNAGLRQLAHRLVGDAEPAR
jgi:hypothetical protein